MDNANDEAFQPRNMVERQLIAAAQGTTEQQKAFERLILEESLYAATPDVGPEGVETLQADTYINLLMVTLADGRQATALFTDPSRVEAVFGEVGCLGMQGRVLFDSIRMQPAILNPGHGYSVVWEPENMSAMIGLPSERKVAKGTNILLGSPVEQPADLIARLREAFASVPQVEAAWLALANWPDSNDQSWYLDVRSTSADDDIIRRALPQAIEGVDLKGMVIDMIINPANGGPGIGISIKEPSGRSLPKKGLLARLFG